MVPDTPLEEFLDEIARPAFAFQKNGFHGRVSARYRQDFRPQAMVHGKARITDALPHMPDQALQVRRMVENGLRPLDSPLMFLLDDCSEKFLL